MKTKFFQEPQSPSHAGQRPFSYGANILSSKLKHTDMNGQSRQSYPNVPVNPREQYFPQNGQYNDTPSASPAVSYGRHESAFSPQPKKPAPAGSPPPLPAEGYTQTPPIPPLGRTGLPNLRMQQRHSVTTLEEGANNRPKIPASTQRERLSKRSKSVPCNPEDIGLPSPPPPVSGKDSYLAIVSATNRPPSPPLPPPPPEMLMSMRNDSPPPPPPPDVPFNQNQFSYNQQMQYHRQHAPADTQPPPPPPVSSIPKRSKEPGTSPSHAGSNSVLPSQSRGSNSVLPPTTDVGHAKREQSPGVLDELSKVQLKRTGNKLCVYWFHRL